MWPQRLHHCSINACPRSMNLGSRNNSFSTKPVLRMRLHCCRQCHRVRGPCRFQQVQGGIQLSENFSQIFIVETRATTQSTCWIHLDPVSTCTITFSAVLVTTQWNRCGTRVFGAEVATTESITTVNDQSFTAVQEMTTAAIASPRERLLQLVLKMGGLLRLKFH